MHNAHPQFPVYCQHLIHLSFHHQCVRMYCQRLIHAHRKNHRRQISIVQINDFQWRGWSLGWSYYYNSQCIAMADDGGWSCYYNHNGTWWWLVLWTCRCCLAYKCSKTLLTAILNIFRIVCNKMNSVVQKQLLKCANIFRHFESDLCGLAWQCLHLLWNCANIAPLSFQITL